MMNLKKILLVSCSCVSLCVMQDASATAYPFNYPDFSRYGGAENLKPPAGGLLYPLGRTGLYPHAHLFSALPPQNLKTGTEKLKFYLNQDNDDTANLTISTAAQGARSAFHAPINQQLTDGIDLPQVVASVCFITDAGECSGGGAGIDEPSSSSSGPGPIEPEPGKQCALEGYVNDVCPEGQQPGTACPYDSGWHTGCVCKPEYNKICTGSDEQGKGASCNGKYKECCKLCSGYDYTATNIPSGYIKGASCQSCDGVKYKIKCDTNSSNTGTYIDCGSAAGSGGSCTDDTGTYYEKCTCPTNYEFNAQTQTCVCKTNFKYACTGTGYAGGQGESCDNKYQTCECATGYSWSATSGCVKCSSSFKYACTGANEVKPSGSNCGGLYDKCSCKSGYKWSGGKCVVEDTCSGTCGVGCLYYSDDTCSTNKVSGKTLLGVVIYNNGTTGWVTTTEPVANAVWSTEFVTTDVKDGAINASCTNTQKLVAKGSKYLAANIANNYNAGDKQWCLPSEELMSSLMDIDTNDRMMHLDKVNTGISIAGGKKLGYIGAAYESIWTSNEAYREYAVHVSTGQGSFGLQLDGFKNDKASVRPVTCFGKDSSPCKRTETPQNGPVGNLCYCDGKVVGVRISDTDYFIGMHDLGEMIWKNANTSVSNYNFCKNVKAKLPHHGLLQYDMSLDFSLKFYGGEELNQNYYWTDTKYKSYEYYADFYNGGYVLGDISGDVYNVRPVTTCQETPEDGPQGDLYYCDGKVVGVKAGDMNFFVAMEDLGEMSRTEANLTCGNYKFCDYAYGSMPTPEQWEKMYYYKGTLEDILSDNGGEKFLKDLWYWSDTPLGESCQFMNMSKGYLSVANCRFDYYVRPVLMNY